MRLPLPIVLAAASMLCVNIAARADVVYTLVDVAPSDTAGTHFTLSSANFLSYGQSYGASGEAFLFGNDEGAITDVFFSLSPEFVPAEGANFDFAVFHGSYNVAQDGVYVDGLGDTLTVSGSPAVTAVTPEPSSLALLGTGILGVVGVMRKRLA